MVLTWSRFLVAICVLTLACPSLACSIPRSAKQRHDFIMSHKCPSTGVFGGKCSGHVVDHVIPLCLPTGKDVSSNMQFQTIADGLAKDKIERQQCAAYRATKK